MNPMKTMIALTFALAAAPAFADEVSGDENVIVNCNGAYHCEVNVDNHDVYNDRTWSGRGPKPAPRPAPRPIPMLCTECGEKVVEPEPVVCVRDEQEGCFSFQVVGILYNEWLMNFIKNTDEATLAENLGMSVYNGMKDGNYTPAGHQGYTLYLWMDNAWGTQPLPGERIVRLALNGTSGSGVADAFPVTWGEPKLAPTLDPQYSNLGRADFALTAEANGRAAGWVIPKDVVEHVAYAMICPDGETFYPFRRDGDDDGITHSGEEIQWYLDENWDFVLSAAMWPR